MQEAHPCAVASPGRTKLGEIDRNGKYISFAKPAKPFAQRAAQSVKVDKKILEQQSEGLRRELVVSQRMHRFNQGRLIVATEALKAMYSSKHPPTVAMYEKLKSALKTALKTRRAGSTIHIIERIEACLTALRLVSECIYMIPLRLRMSLESMSHEVFRTMRRLERQHHVTTDEGITGNLRERPLLSDDAAVELDRQFDRAENAKSTEDGELAKLLGIISRGARGEEQPLTPISGQPGALFGNGGAAKEFDEALLRTLDEDALKETGIDVFYESNAALEQGYEGYYSELFSSDEESPQKNSARIKDKVLRKRQQLEAATLDQDDPLSLRNPLTIDATGLISPRMGSMQRADHNSSSRSSATAIPEEASLSKEDDGAVPPLASLTAEPPRRLTADEEAALALQKQNFELKEKHIAKSETNILLCQLNDGLPEEIVTSPIANRVAADRSALQRLEQEEQELLRQHQTLISLSAPPTNVQPPVSAHATPQLQDLSPDNLNPTNNGEVADWHNRTMTSFNPSSNELTQELKIAPRMFVAQRGQRVRKSDQIKKTAPLQRQVDATPPRPHPPPTAPQTARTASSSYATSLHLSESNVNGPNTSRTGLQLPSIAVPTSTSGELRSRQQAPPTAPGTSRTSVRFTPQLTSKR